MTHGCRWILMGLALAFAGCGGKTGLAGAKPDSGTPGSGNPNPDTGTPGSGNPNPDTAVPDTIEASPDVPDQPKGMAILTVNPTAIDFGAVDVGMTSMPVSVTVSNVGTAPSGSLTVTVVGAGIAASGCSGMTLAPQTSCTISVTTQGTGGPISGTIEVGDSPTNSKKIAVSAIDMLGPTGVLSLSTSSLDLGSVLPGKTASGTIVATNNTAKIASGIVINVSGTGFARSTTGTCTETLAAGQTCNIDVSFSAGTTSGPAKGSVIVSMGGVTKTVAVTATIMFIEASLKLVPPSASLQTVFGTPSAPFTFNVTGDVSSAATVTITGTNKDDFSFTTTCPKGDAAPVDSCQVTIVYNPKTAPTGNSAATLTVAGSALGATATATLTGNATPSTTPANPADLIPVDNTVSGWTVDTENHTGGSKAPRVASTKDMGGSLIDGGIEPFYADGFSPKLFVWQDYYNTHLPTAPADSLNPKGAMLTLYLFRMSSADQASGLYKNLLQFSEYTRKATATSNGWEEPTTPLVGARSRIQDTGADWWINFQKNECYGEIKLTPSNGPAPDYEPGNPELKKEALRFAQAVAERL